MCSLASLFTKYEENSNQVPRFSEINNLHKNDYTANDYNNTERLIFCYFHYKINFPTPANYASHYMQGCLTIADVNQQTTIYSLFFDLKELVQKYLIDVVDNVHFMQNYQPSLLAAAVIAVSRIKLGLKPWFPTLENLSGYFIEDLADPIEILQRKYELHCENCP